MKKNALRITTVIAAALVMIVMLFAIAKTDVFGEPYKADLTAYEGQIREFNLGSTYDPDMVVYYQIKPSKTGIVTFVPDYNGKVALCNSNGDAISYGSSSGDSIEMNSIFSYKKMISYGVKAGRTYYIRMTGFPSSPDSTGNYYIRVKWTNGKVAAAKSGTKRSKAKSLKRKKTYKGLIKAGDGKAKWYKVTTKRRTINMLFKATKSSGAIKVTVYMRKYGHKGKLIPETYKAGRGYGYVKGPLTNPNGTKWTVYFKVQRAGKNSGYYTLKWK